MLVTDAEQRAIDMLEKAEGVVLTDRSRAAAYTQLAFAYVALAECLKS